MKSIVSLDLETTGLDSQTDVIIEIGAVRFNGQRIEDEFTTLINPKRHIPEFITGLTGINDAMVRQAPSILDVVGELASFIGECPILGQNIKFDLAFLKKFDFFEHNQKIDTYEMASVLLPSANRYNLGALGQYFNIPFSTTHRALDDARLTKAVFLKLEAMISQLPMDVLGEIVHHSEPLDWDGAWPFKNALRSHLHNEVREEPTAENDQQENAGSDHRVPQRVGKETRMPVIQVPEEPLPIDPDEAAAILEYGSQFSRYFDNYEYRPEQVEMLRAVANALSYGQHLLVEAGTGTGKSFAYLVPSALFALQNNTRVLISTNTINLQDQLINKDIPDLCAALGVDVRAVVLKGRSNYLCPRRLRLLRRRGPSTPDEMRVLAKILVWRLRDLSGDRTAINLTGSVEREIWGRISAEDDACTGDICYEREQGACPFYNTRQAALNAHIIIVNHALLLTDVALGSRILPEYQHVIIDEGHHLENATTNALSFRLTQWDLEHLIKEVGGAGSGILGQVITAVRDQVRPSDFAAINQKVERATDLAWRFQEQARAFFIALMEFITIQRDGRSSGTYAYQERIIPASRTQPGWDEVELSWGAAAETIHLLIKLVGEIQKGSADLYTDGIESLEDVIGSLGIISRRFVEAENMIGSMVFEPASDYVYWVDVNPNNDRITLNAAPVRVGPLVEKYLWHEKRSVILTSATLTTHGQFDYIRQSVSADEADEMTVGSPFDYETAALMYIPNDISEPHSADYQHQVEQTLIALCEASAGRTMVLFTSYAQLKRTARAITGPLAKIDIITYEQGEGASPNALLESFRGSDRAVLLGTRSFWEGVDVPGEALSVLVIVKLPFAVPTDPMVAARSETFEDPFNEYQLPEAILRFRQGFGRLIRTQSDRGVVVVLDRRILTKSYGKYFINSLPKCTLQISSMAELPKKAASWLGT